MSEPEKSCSCTHTFHEDCNTTCVCGGAAQVSHWCSMACEASPVCREERPTRNRLFAPGEQRALNQSEVTCPGCKAWLEMHHAVLTGGVRANSGKLRYSLISAEAEEGLARVLTFGATKYAARNWEKGLSWSDTIDSLRRHLSAFMRGEELDPESGLPHLDHMACNVMFLSHFQKTFTGTDDRVKRK